MSIQRKFPNMNMITGKRFWQRLEMKGQSYYGLLENIDLKKYFEAADLILNSKQIFICGRGISWTMAEYMKNRLSSCEVLGITANTELNDDVYGMLTSLTEESLLIPISFPDYYFMTTKVTERARMQNAKYWQLLTVWTQQWRSAQT